jgi:ABC-type transporter MlaC component
MMERDAVSLYGGESIAPARATVQRTLIDRTTGMQLTVEYWLMFKDRRWAVFDVIVDGVSLALSPRAQLDRILQRASSATFLQMLKSKAEKESSERVTRLRATLAGQG